MGTDLSDLLKHFGLSGESLDRIRLARGVVGKTSYVAFAALIALAAVAWSLRDAAYLMALAVLVVLLFVFYLVGVLWFSNKHPELALLEGAELIQWRKIEIAAKEAPTLTQENTVPKSIGQGSP